MMGGMEEQFRTAVVGTIAGVSSEIQRDIIAKTLGCDAESRDAGLLIRPSAGSVGVRSTACRRG